MTATKNLLSLPRDLLVELPEYLHNIEDYMNLSSTCHGLRDCMIDAAPNTILRLAAAQTKIFFRPSPHFLVAATARELGHWARKSDENEGRLVEALQQGIDGVLELALEHCGLTMKRIRELHLMRFEVINPVTDIIDKCVGQQWYDTPNFWDGGVDDAYTIDSDPPECLFHLAIYGELFGPDLDALLDQDQEKRTLRLDTRLEYVKYCVPDFAIVCTDSEAEDERLKLKPTGPYKPLPRENAYNVEYEEGKNNLIALVWVLRSSRWRPHWKSMRELAGCEDFADDGPDTWYPDDSEKTNWRQRLFENVMVCQGLEGLEMIRPAQRERWVEKVREWREKIAAMEKEPPTTKVGMQDTHEYAYLMGDLRVCARGYAGGY